MSRKDAGYNPFGEPGGVLMVFASHAQAHIRTELEAVDWDCPDTCWL